MKNTNDVMASGSELEIAVLSLIESKPGSSPTSSTIEGAVIFQLFVCGERVGEVKALKITTLETFCRKVCLKKGLEYEIHSFEYGSPSRPAEMDLLFANYLDVREIYLVKKAKLYSPVSTLENQEETVISNMIEGKPLIVACKMEKILELMTDPAFEGTMIANS